MPSKHVTSVQAADESDPFTASPVLQGPAPEHLQPCSAARALQHTQDSLELASTLAASEDVDSSIQDDSCQHAAGQHVCVAQQLSCGGTEDLVSSTATFSGQLHDATQLQTPSMTADHDANIVTASDSILSSHMSEVLWQPHSMMQLGQAKLVACLRKFQSCISQLQQHCQHILKFRHLPTFGFHIKQMAHSVNLKLRDMYSHMDSLRTKQLKVSKATSNGMHTLQGPV